MPGISYSTGFGNGFWLSAYFSKRINRENAKIKEQNKTVIEKEQKDYIHIETDKAAVLLEGHPGIGKTSIVFALANDFNMEVVETNASDTRTRKALENRLKERLENYYSLTRE